MPGIKQLRPARTRRRPFLPPPAYDGDGLLRSRTEGGNTTRFLWEASPAPLLQAGSDRVVHGLGPLYLVRQNGTTRTFVRDALGSVRAEVTDQGLATKVFRYAAYGDIVQPNANTPTLLGFAGELRDPSGLIYLRARWYDVGTGRFMVRDPFRGTPKRPATLNGYAYAGCRPAVFADPLGLDPQRTMPGRDTIGFGIALVVLWLATIGSDRASLAALPGMRLTRVSLGVRPTRGS